MPTYKKKSRK